ncbi:RDD family protein [Anoxynatronum sibiricum]|uniref:RDD family protein n=1 Tax=Anoxynatronum sibiricum TaxID=210623 RepID=A0ABU9VT92_9CLOT
MTEATTTQIMADDGKPVKEVESTVVGHPWRRLIARSFDQSLYGILWAAIHYFIIRWHPPNHFLINLLDSYIILGMMMVIEPALLAFWGTTPGKFIFGLEIRNTDGSLLTYKQGFSRMLGVFAKGLGYGIPIYNLVRCWRSSEATLQGEVLEWDEGLSYQLKDTRQLRGWIMAIAYVTVLASAFWIIMQAQLPVHRGDLTPETYAANVNDMLTRPNRGAWSRRMTATGEWVEIEDHRPNRYYFDFDFDGPPPKHELTVENGVVTGVSFEVERTDTDFWQPTYSHQKELMVMAFVGAQKNVSGYGLIFGSGLQEMLSQRDSYAREIAGVRITNEVTRSGFDQVGVRSIPKEGQEQYHHVIFRLEKIK